MQSNFENGWYKTEHNCFLVKDGIVRCGFSVKQKSLLKKIIGHYEVIVWLLLGAPLVIPFGVFDYDGNPGVSLGKVIAFSILAIIFWGPFLLKRFIKK